MNFIKNLFLGCFSFSTMIMNAQDAGTIQTDRPDQTESPYIVPKNFIQVETGILFESNQQNEYIIQHPNLLFKYGVHDRVELRFVSELATLSTENFIKTSINTLAIGLKTKITEENGIIPKTSLIIHFNIPYQFKKKNQIQYIFPDFRFLMQHQISEKLNLSYNIGIEWDIEHQKPSYIYTLTMGYSIHDKIGCYIEAYGFFQNKEYPNFNIDGGFTYLVNPNIQLDISASKSLNKYYPGYYLSAGISIRKK